MLEKDFAASVLERLGRTSFTIKKEVSGITPWGAAVRIDAIAIPRDYSNWKRKDVVLGIEFKQPERTRAGQVNQHMKQCIDYSYADFPPHNDIPIFMCPGLSPFRREDMVVDNGFACYFSHFLGQFRIGELSYLKNYGLTFLMHEQHRIWSSRFGVEEGKRWTLRRTTGGI